VRTDAGARRQLDAGYVAEHLQHAYALTAHTIQGGTVEWAGVVGAPRDFTRNWSYTALSRARQATELFLIDTPTERERDRADIAPNHDKELTDRRPLFERLSSVMRQRDDEDLALDRLHGTRALARPHARLPDTDAPAVPELARMTVAELRTELDQLRARLGRDPDALARQLEATRAARAEAQGIANAARQRISELEQPHRGWLGRRRAEPSATAFEQQRLDHAERQAAAAADRERHLAPQNPDTPETHALRERAAELQTQLSLRRNDHVRTALENPAPYLEATLGPIPDEPRARRTWQTAAKHIEAYRFDHAITDTADPLGPQPPLTERGPWQRAQQDLARAQRDLRHRIQRGFGHNL
jgi:hypothetical protein